MGKGALRTVPVTMRALTQRINRALLEDGKILKQARARAEPLIGRYYLLNARRNVIAQQHVDPEALGRELGVLMEYEHVLED